MLLAAVCELGIDLIRENEDIGAAKNVSDRLKVFLLHDTAGGVVGERKEQRLGLGSDGCLQSLCGELELIVSSGDNVYGNAARENYAGVISNVCGLGDNDFVALGDERADSEVDRLARADGNEYLAVRFIMDAVTLVQIPAYKLTQLGHTAVGRVRDAAVGQTLQSFLPDSFGRGEIRFADAEADRLVGQNVKILANTGRRYILHSFNNKFRVIHF